jgi:hypothetical protein
MLEGVSYGTFQLDQSITCETKRLQILLSNSECGLQNGVYFLSFYLSVCIMGVAAHWNFSFVNVVYGPTVSTTTFGTVELHRPA